ncbi:hypothetical protein M434DRAFT_15491 [Hypoxylon sp. CO27-5]|nr:hypothetical protein M434DRAFT_15491 [Hypoxylon sp. CO27-5]
MPMMSHLDASSSTEEHEAHIGISPKRASEFFCGDVAPALVASWVASGQLNMPPRDVAFLKAIIEETVREVVHEEVESIRNSLYPINQELVESVELGILARSFQLECIEDELKERQKEMHRRMKDYKDDNKAAREVKEPPTIKEMLRTPVSYPAVGLVVLVLVGLLWWIGVGSSG